MKNVTLLNVQNGHIRYSKLTAKEAEGLQWKKICVNILGPYVILRNSKIENLTLKAIPVISSVTV